MEKIITTLGPIGFEDVDIILPHEHVFADLRTWKQPGYAVAETEDVIGLMKPELIRSKACGVSIIAESTPVGVGRRADILKAVSEAAEFPLVVPTGVYREPWIPDWIHKADESEIMEWMVSELTDNIEGSGVQAGWIKLSAGNDGLTGCEAKVLRAAAKAGAAAGAVIGSHTIKGSVVGEQLDIIEKCGYMSNRFIWIHAQAEPDFKLHLEMAKRGAWVEYDAIGSLENDPVYIEYILKMMEHGFGNNILISHDRGWYDPASVKGGKPLPYTYICEVFLPRLRQTGVDEKMIVALTTVNPFNAFARSYG